MEQQEIELSPLPENVLQWDQEHFEQARLEGDPKLIEAIRHLGRSSIDNEAVVQMLVAMLQPLNLYERNEANRLAEAVVEALAINDTLAAREVLEQIITGRLDTEGDELKAVEAALNALVEHPTTGNEELLFRLLTATDQYRKPSGSAAAVVPGPAGKGAVQPLSAEWLRGRVLELLEETASVGFRAKLAAFLFQPTTPLGWRKEMSRFLLEPNADNLGAQFVMYQGGRLEDDARLRIEQHFATRSAQAMQISRRKHRARQAEQPMCGARGLRRTEPFGRPRTPPPNWRSA